MCHLYAILNLDHVLPFAIYRMQKHRENVSVRDREQLGATLPKQQCDYSHMQSMRYDYFRYGWQALVISFKIELVSLS